MAQTLVKQRSSFTAREIQALFKLGKRTLRSEGLDVIMYPSLLPFGRILVVTSRKTGTAPWRNKVRRRLKAIFYTRQLYAARMDCIVIMKKPGLAYSYEQLESMLCPLFPSLS